MEKFILTIDEGTTSTRAIVVNKKCEIVSVDQAAFAQIFPQEGWVEQDAIEIWNAVRTTVTNSLNKAHLTLSQIEAIGITNQRETVVVWDKETGIPIYNAIVWQDKRTAKFCESFTQQEVDAIRDKTGLFINPYFSASKVKWILDNVEGAQKLANKGRLFFGTINTWLIYRLTAGEVFATDRTNACRTLLYNIQTNDWDQSLLDIFGIPKSMLPSLKSNSETYGYTFPGLVSKVDTHKVPITSSIGDQQAALFGQLAVNKGEAKVTYGTGCFILMNTASERVFSQHGLLTTVVSDYDGVIKYGIEGSVLVAGAAVQWLRDSLRLVYNELETEWYSGQVNDDRRVYVVPAFTGLGSPYWDNYARGAIFGLDRGTKREHIVRATLEAIAYQVNDVLEAMSKDMGKKFSSIKVDGGASNNRFLMQFQANISQTTIIKPQNVETTAMGATYLAGLATGFWKNLEEIKKHYVIALELKPTETEAQVAKKIKGWKAAVQRTFSWVLDVE
ncbi:glycerol kinase [Entomoplasma freundtii]|uniref:Glycerol kinase n=1 Tax=Entomoplasma freundtii TaxID=74700 RepID=A0A2K8NQF1_9MOLU|nr:glycerol kinase GlpK [Entomoplasma freundtii]ATZ16049.1 glycerol kinase [Entomoplasma freundtii]TDY58082.1 glycerol kinase [Entomoplasma freundtii]